MPDFLEVCKTAKFTKAVSRMVVASGWLRRGSKELLLNEYNVSGMKKESVLDSWYTTLCLQRTTPHCTRKRVDCPLNRKSTHGVCTSRESLCCQKPSVHALNSKSTAEL